LVKQEVYGLAFILVEGIKTTGEEDKKIKIFE